MTTPPLPESTPPLPESAPPESMPPKPETAPPTAPPPPRPEYKGAPLDPERGPGLGCFWLQVALLVGLLILTPLSVIWAWDSRISGTLLVVTLIVLLFVGQTTIFLLRLVAADRRTRRRPLSPSARPTIGDLESEPPSDEDHSAAS